MPVAIPRSSKLLVVSLVGAIFCAGSALASETRLMTLGRPAGLDDESMVFGFPSLVTLHSLAIAELGTPGAGSTEAHAGVLAQTGAGGVGLFVSRDQSLFTYRNPDTLSADVPDIVQSFYQRYNLHRKGFAAAGVSPQRPLDVFFAGALSEGSGYGVRLTIAGDTEEFDGDDKLKKGASQFDLHAGFHMPVGAARLDLGLKIGLLGTLESEVTKGGAKTESTFNRNPMVRLLARVVTGGAERLKPFVKIGAEFASPTLKGNQANTAYTRKGRDLAFDLQGGANFVPVEAVILTGGLAGFYFDNDGPYTLAPTPPGAPTLDVAIRSGSETVGVNLVTGDKSIRRGYGLLSTLGAEAFVTENWALLTGLQYPLWGRLVTLDGFAANRPKYTTNLQATPDASLWSFGISYRKEALRIDAAAAIKNFLHAGPNFITGGTSAPILAQVAATYHF